MKTTIAFLSFFFISLTLLAQSERNCSTMSNLQFRKQANPQLEKRMQSIEAFTQNRVQKMRSASVNTTVITIPVVVHVIYNTPEENISEAQIQSQIDVLNEDFRRLNADKDDLWQQAADTQIQFCMAKTDPEGKPTNGITRKASSRTIWGTEDVMKRASTGGVDAWDTSVYLNMWVCNIGNGYLGYAQFPGGSPLTDGVVMSPQYFGSYQKGTGFYLKAPFNLGRTATHEVGHFFNLRHIWGDGGCSQDDFVSDTPVSDAANYNCRATHTSCGTKDMVQNYMDYSDDFCMNLFTQGQKDRMRATLSSGGFRYSLSQSDKCNAPGPPTCTDGVKNGDETGIDCGGANCEPCQMSCTDNNVKVSVTFDKYPEEVSWMLTNTTGDTVAMVKYSTGTTDGSTSTKELCLPDGCYTFTIKDAYGDGICCEEGNGNYTITYGDTVLASGGDFNKIETKTICIGVGATCGDGVQNGDETNVDCGGSCQPCATTTINEAYFEAGLDYWEDGGDDCFRYSGKRSFEGDYAMRLRDNSGEASAITSIRYDVSMYKSIDVEFYFYAYSMENNERFMFRFYNGATWQTVESWSKGTDFKNNTFYKATLSINAADYAFTKNVQFRFENNASSNSDHIYIDHITIKGVENALKSSKSTLEAIRSLNENETPEISFTVYPNPAKGDRINIRMVERVEGTYKMVNMMGQIVKQDSITEEINIANLKKGVYFLTFNVANNDTIVKRVVRN